MAKCYGEYLPSKTPVSVVSDGSTHFPNQKPHTRCCAETLLTMKLNSLSCTILELVCSSDFEIGFFDQRNSTQELGFMTDSHHLIL